MVILCTIVHNYANKKGGKSKRSSFSVTILSCTHLAFALAGTSFDTRRGGPARGFAAESGPVSVQKGATPHCWAKGCYRCYIVEYQGFKVLHLVLHSCYMGATFGFSRLFDETRPKMGCTLCALHGKI
jgi:hypothetical protein